MVWMRVKSFSKVFGEIELVTNCVVASILRIENEFPRNAGKRYKENYLVRFRLRNAWLGVDDSEVLG
ncbi:hypothetical protein EV696_113103 [Permianibacter aggregans]|uniref:Uncharacterized protein n=1 Tax=Permianibacter aggregans TaxID=1510150 RepID=A0A4R6UJ94_9GAMM|nr:hypothetical protein EV696_113103 [Permianibacter aggregans]